MLLGLAYGAIILLDQAERSNLFGAGETFGAVNRQILDGILEGVNSVILGIYWLRSHAYYDPGSFAQLVIPFIALIVALLAWVYPRKPS